MTRALPILLLFLATTTALFAQQNTISVEPADPRSTEPVTLIVTQLDSCPPPPVVTRSGFSITVELIYGPCLSPPHLITWRLDLGVLAAGTYTVNLKGTTLTSTFTVLDANNSVVVQPSIGPIGGGTSVFVTADVPDTPTITFGGIAATSVIPAGFHQWRVGTPPHAAGAVLVTVTSGSVTRSSYAFRYYDPAAAPLPELFAKILIPIFYDGPGQLGSSWATEVALKNDNAYDVVTYRGPDALPVIPAGKPQIAGFSPSPGGIFMIVPREAAPALHANIMIRDVSRALQAWGTEVPVVREERFANSIELLNVPVDPRFRTQLRIYGLDSTPMFLQVVATSMLDGSLVGTRDVELKSVEPCDLPAPCASSHPSFASLSGFPDVPSPLPGERVAIRIDAFAPIWAFVTLTNNETQHVTVISPQ